LRAGAATAGETVLFDAAISPLLPARWRAAARRAATLRVFLIMLELDVRKVDGGWKCLSASLLFLPTRSQVAFAMDDIRAVTGLGSSSSSIEAYQIE
jgi:hypothetical protein